MILKSQKKSEIKYYKHKIQQLTKTKNVTFYLSYYNFLVELNVLKIKTEIKT